MRNLDELKEAVEDSRIQKDTDFFRSAVGEMLNRLGFEKKVEEFISFLEHHGYVASNSLRAARKADKHACRSYLLVVDRAFRQAYARNCDYFSVSTHHESWDAFAESRMHLQVLSANCLLEPGKSEKDVEELFTEENQDVSSVFEKAFDAGFVPVSINPVQEEKLFFYTPKTLYAILTQDS
ncbi:hypothetical protein GF343_00250 [Candidatus Woesearchaeota archaeon]|nr:hypothetical protein [Candidatus Woesearchaeota archaeon]